MLIKLAMTFFALITPIENGESNQVQQLNQQIQELKDLQEKYRWSAQRNANNAMRWQFQSENYPDARKAWNKAAQDKEKIKAIQVQIDALEAKKQALLKGK